MTPKHASLGGVNTLKPASEYAVDLGMSENAHTDLTVTAIQIRDILGHADSVIVWLPAIGLLDVAATGLTKAQRLHADRIRVAVTHAEAREYLAAAKGDHVAAAAIASAVLRAQAARGVL
jgi:hypothetical protein